MPVYPAASWRPIPETHTQGRIRPRAVIVHSTAGRGSLYGWWLNPDSDGLEAHFWVAETGRVEQYVDTTVRADANGDANAFAISIETESSPAATERWTEAQARAIVDLIVWCCRTHGIPPRVMTSSTGSGLGWHVMFGAPGPWTKVRGKTCPGPARIPQFRGEVVPAVQRALGAQPQEDPFPMLTDAEQRELLTLARRIDKATAAIQSGMTMLARQAGLAKTYARRGWARIRAEHEITLDAEERRAVSDRAGQIDDDARRAEDI